MVLFVTPIDIKRNTIINGNLDSNEFMQFIKIAQQIHIQNYLGTDLYNKFQTLIIDGDINQSGFLKYKTLLSNYIKPMLIHWSMVHYLPFAAYTIANKGVYKHSSENATNVEKNEIDFLVEKERDIAEHYTQRFIDYMCFQQQEFPEYTSNSNDDMNPDTNNFYGSWVL